MLPLDLSAVHIDGLSPSCTREDIRILLATYGFNVSMDNIRVSKADADSFTNADVRIEDPAFA